MSDIDEDDMLLLGYATRAEARAARDADRAHYVFDVGKVRTFDPAKVRELVDDLRAAAYQHGMAQMSEMPAPGDREQREADMRESERALLDYLGCAESVREGRTR